MDAAQKIALIQETNPTWEDLSAHFDQKIVPMLNGQRIPFGNDNQIGLQAAAADVAPFSVDGTGK